MNDELVTRHELAEIMRVSVKTVDRMRREGMPHITWGRRLVRFRVGEAISWADRQQRARNLGSAGQTKAGDR
jgi:phage terminase Nu1 subunit (DNA packaging protein)